MSSVELLKHGALKPLVNYPGQFPVKGNQFTREETGQR